MGCFVSSRYMDTGWLVYPLKYVKLYLGTEEWACWKASSIGFVFYISKWLVDVIPVDASRIFVFSERKAISRDTSRALFSAAKNAVFLLSGSDAPWYLGKLVIWPSISLWPGWQFWAISAVTSQLHLWLSCSYPILLRCAHYHGVKAPVPRRCQEQRCFHLSQGQAYAKIPMDCGDVSVAFSALLLGFQLQMCYV